jgi:hypothetical protein
MKALPEIPGQANAVVMPTRNVTRMISTAELAEEGDEGKPFPLRRLPLKIGRVFAQSAETHAVLEILEDGQVVERIPIDDAEIVVGRADAESGITPEIDLTPFDPKKTVSRRHAIIRRDNGAVLLEDLHSTNKTKVRGSSLSAGEPKPLRDRDVVTFGSVRTEFRLVGTSDLPTAWSAS